MTDETPIPQPVQLRWVRWAVYAWCGLTILSALALLGQRTFISDALRKANAKADQPKVPYTEAMVHHDATYYLRYTLLQAVLVSLILVLVTFAVLRGRSWARWLLIGMATVLPLLFPVLPVGILVQLLNGVFASIPFIYRLPLVLSGLAALTVVVLLFLPEVRAYFGAVRAQEGSVRSRIFPPVGARAQAGQARAAGGLFGARRASGKAVGGVNGAAASSTPGSASSTPGSASSAPAATSATPGAQPEAAAVQPKRGAVEPEQATPGRPKGKRSGAAPKSRLQ